jgi:tetratricopeptide (TPR) repeat protein
MIGVSAETRKRILLMITVAVVILGGWAIAGALQPTTTDSSAPRPEELSDAVQRQRLIRGLRQALQELGRQQNWAAVIASVDTACGKENISSLLLLRAEAYLRSGRDADAARDFDAALEGAGPIVDADRHALASRVNDYQKLCKRLIAQTPLSSVRAMEANNAAWACVLLPDALSDYTPVVALARQAVEKAQGEERATYLNTLGVALVRAGKSGEAITTLLESERLHPDLFNAPFLAMAYHREGKTAQAQQWATRFRTRIGETFGGDELNRHELLLFTRELSRTLP